MMDTRYIDARFEEIERTLNLLVNVLDEDIKDYLEQQKEEQEEVKKDKKDGKHTKSKPIYE